MKFQFVPVRIQKVQGISLALVLFPDPHIMRADSLSALVEGPLLHGKRYVGVLMLGFATLARIQRQTDPPFASEEICTP